MAASTTVRHNADVVSYLEQAYDGLCHEIGYGTNGHRCIDDTDRIVASSTKSSLLYGELLPSGVTKALNKEHLDAESAQILYDFGMGTGKVALQAFLQCPTLHRVVGIEIAFSRFNLGEQALLRLVDLYPTRFSIVKWSKHQSICIEDLRSTTAVAATAGTAAAAASSSSSSSRSGSSKSSSRSGSGKSSSRSGSRGSGPSLKAPGSRRSQDGGREPGMRRTLEFRRADLFACADVGDAQIAILQTDFEPRAYANLSRLLLQLRRGTRVLTYIDLRRVWSAGLGGESSLSQGSTPPQRFPYVQFHLSRFLTSWSAVNGHPFFLWQRVQRGSVVGSSTPDDRLGSCSCAPAHADFGCTDGQSSRSQILRSLWRDRIRSGATAGGTFSSGYSHRGTKDAAARVEGNADESLRMMQLLSKHVAIPSHDGQRRPKHSRPGRSKRRGSQSKLAGATASAARCSRCRHAACGHKCKSQKCNDGGGGGGGAGTVRKAAGRGKGKPGESRGWWRRGWKHVTRLFRRRETRKNDEQMKCSQSLESKT